VLTSIGYRDIAGFAAFWTIVQTVSTQPHGVLAFADGAVFFAGAVRFGLFTLSTDHRSGHYASPQTLNDCTRAHYAQQGALVPAFTRGQWAYGGKTAPVEKRG
jgi:hypothetical protein